MAKYRYLAPIFAWVTMEFETEHEPGTDEFMDDATDARHTGRQLVSGAVDNVTTNFQIDDRKLDEEWGELVFEKVS